MGDFSLYAILMVHTRIHPSMQDTNLAGRQDINEDPGTSKFEGSDVQIRRIPQQDL